MRTKAVIFDLDGLLIDSEPIWQQVERDAFGSLGLRLTPEQCEQTTGLRVDEVVQHWFHSHPWTSPSQEKVVEHIVANVAARIRREGQVKPGVAEALDAARAMGWRLALASSSWPVVIDSALERLDLVDTFEVIHSAQQEHLGKPHPAVFLSTAAQLGVSPLECLAVEDSINGMVAAKAARMTVVAVPDVPPSERAPFALADVILDSLKDFTVPLLRRIAK